MSAVDEAKAGGRRRERGGRAAQREARSQHAGAMGRPYIVRNIPPYDILSDENLIRIERAADRILAETGIEFRDDPVALEHWRRAGASVDGVLVRFEPGMLRETPSNRRSISYCRNESGLVPRRVMACSVPTGITDFEVMFVS